MAKRILVSESIMPYCEHDLFKVPNDENISIWRYMDFPKFVSLLHRRKLFFCRAKEMAEIDPFEGSLPQRNIEGWKAFPDAWIADNEARGAVISEDVREKIRSAGDKRRSIYKVNLLHVFMNCWHINQHESAGMWSIYGKNDIAIAVKSSLKILMECFAECKYDVYIGHINYIDYEKDMFNDSNLFAPFLHKRKSFEHEQELRAILWRHEDKIQDDENFIKENDSESPAILGIYAPCNLEHLIQNICIGPQAPTWLFEDMKSVVEKFGINPAIVSRSRINDPGLF